MKRLSILCVLSIISFCSCHSSRHIAKDDCQEYYNILIEFASKMSPYKDTCYVFDFEKDINKFIKYNEFGGKTKFMDYRLNEVLYYQHHLTNEFLDLSNASKICLRKYSKEDIIKLFGDPSVENKFYNYYTYFVVTEKKCSFCTGDKDDDYYCANSIQFYFTKDEQKCSDIFINIFHL